MTLNELIDKLQKLSDRGHGDDLVGVRMTNCLSSNTCNPVTGVGPGIDWERKKIMISVEHPAERYYTPKQREEQAKQAQEAKQRAQDAMEKARIAKNQSATMDMWRELDQKKRK